MKKVGDSRDLSVACSSAGGLRKTVGECRERKAGAAMEKSKGEGKKEWGINGSTQSEVEEMTAIDTQTVRRTYASVVAQAEGAGDTEDARDKMEVD